MKSTTDIQRKSDEKRGLKVKSLKLHVDTIALLEQLSDQTGAPQSQVVRTALNMFAKALKETKLD